MRVRFVRLFKGQQKLEAVVDVGDGSSRKVVYTWKTREERAIPPEGWLNQVLKEIVFQRRSGMERKIAWKPKR